MTAFGRAASSLGPSRFTVTGGTRQDHGEFTSFTFTAGSSLTVSGRLISGLDADIIVVGGGAPGTSAAS